VRLLDRAHAPLLEEQYKQYTNEKMWKNYNYLRFQINNNNIKSQCRNCILLLLFVVRFNNSTLLICIYFFCTISSNALLSRLRSIVGTGNGEANVKREHNVLLKP